ncbi:MAG: nucleotide exchange factor GrpE [Elusimicrobia bacterium]|nr:nucleotide exchange factor GrpE [Elusimicrobiota bacterium]
MSNKKNNKKENQVLTAGAEATEAENILSAEDENILTPGELDKTNDTLVTSAAKEKIAELKLLSVSLSQEKEKAEDYYTQLVSLKAEFDNYRKRAQKESAQMASYGKKSVIKEFLPVMDNVLRFEEAVSGGDSPSLEGMEIIIKELKKTFAALGVKQMDCMGKEFSPHVHEAVFKERTNDFKDGTVIKVVSNGYYLGDEVLKPAMVAVAENMPEKESETPAEASNDNDGK